jgi:hypothetical protein
VTDSELLRAAKAILNYRNRTPDEVCEPEFAVLALRLRAAIANAESQQASAGDAAQVKLLWDALDNAIQVAWDGPREPKGSACAEGYYAWRCRIERECKAVLFAVSESRNKAAAEWEDDGA